MQRWLDCARESLGAQVVWLDQRPEDREGTAGAKPPPPPQEQADPYQVLHLRDTAPWPLVKSAFKTLSRLHHPDVGGSEEEMKRLNAAYEALEQRLKAA